MIKREHKEVWGGDRSCVFHCLGGYTTLCFGHKNCAPKRVNFMVCEKVKLSKEIQMAIPTFKK